MSKPAILGTVCIALLVPMACGQTAAPNYDEAKIPPYTLPDPLLCADGTRVTSARVWEKKRRPELLRLFEEHVYGRAPGRLPGMTFEVVEQDRNALGGRATHKQVRIWFTGRRDGPSMDLLLYLPNGARGRVPAFLGLNFNGNHAVQPDPAIRLSTRWMVAERSPCIVSNRATEACRGIEAARWPIEKILERGYALATAYYGDLEPDHSTGWKDGIRAALAGKFQRPLIDTGLQPGGRAGSESSAASAALPAGAKPLKRFSARRPHPTGLKPGVNGMEHLGCEVSALSPAGTNTMFAPDAWGAISAWAWGLSRALDYLETERAVDAKRVAVMGHSRLGKTALWAGARDQRFAIVISNNSGEGGAALARRWYGETTADLNRRFPHWFCGNFKQYSDNVTALPVDQHELIALIAPRPVYVASAEEDRWADPRGEFLAALHAEPVYRLYRRPGLGVAEMPPLNTPVGSFIGYHIRTGRHDVTDYDWERYLDFADRHFRR